MSKFIICTMFFFDRSDTYIHSVHIKLKTISKKFMIFFSKYFFENSKFPIYLDSPLGLRYIRH